MSFKPPCLHPPDKQSRGLPTDVLRQLLQDIEDQGGFQNVLKLKTLCARRPEMYGLPGSALRRAVQNKTQRLKQMNRAAYLELLLSLGVESFTHQQQCRLEQRKMPTKQATGIKEKQLKSLLQDIKANGGLNYVVAPTLRNICNCKPDVYGLPGTKERRIIQNKMHTLKLLSRTDYLEMLSAMGIKTMYP